MKTMNATRRNITAATLVVILAFLGICSNHAVACEGSGCPNTPVSPAANSFQSLQRDTGLALTGVGAVNASVGSLNKKLRNANWRLAELQKRTDANSAAVQAQISTLQVEVVELQQRLRSSCASIHEVSSAQACWVILDRATGGTQMTALSVINNALQSGAPFSGTVAIGASDVTPGAYIKFDSPSADAGIPPAFARTRVIAPAESYNNKTWIYAGIPIATTLGGGLIGYGVGDDSRDVTETNAAGEQTTRHQEGNKVETTAIGMGLGLATGLVIDGIIYAFSGHDEEVVSRRTTTTTVSH